MFAAPADSAATSEEQSAPQAGAAASRPRGRRQYAAQQYDFNAPAPPGNDQQAAYYGQAYQQQLPPSGAGVAQPQYDQPPQQGHAYGQEYQQPGFQQDYNAPYPGQSGVPSMTNQFQKMHVSQVIDPFPFYHVSVYDRL